MSRFLIASIIALACSGAILTSTIPATAQVGLSQSNQFLKAVREGDGNKVNELLATGGAIIANSRGGSRDETALHIVVRRHDSLWTRYLMQKGARPDVVDAEGVTPLMIAVFNDNVDIVRLLVSKGAGIDFTNTRGETALIRAVQLRKLTMVRELIKLGADPDKQDYVLGMSARDYAERDNRSRTLVDALTPVTEDATDVDESIGPAFPVDG